MLLLVGLGVGQAWPESAVAAFAAVPQLVATVEFVVGAPAAAALGIVARVATVVVGYRADRALVPMAATASAVAVLGIHSLGLHSESMVEP